MLVLSTSLAVPLINSGVARSLIAFTMRIDVDHTCHSGGHDHRLLHEQEYYNNSKNEQQCRLPLVSELLAINDAELSVCHCVYVPSISVIFTA